MTRLKALAGGALSILGPLGIILGYYLFLRPEAEPVIAEISCSFAAREDQGPVRLGEYTAPLETLELAGDLSHPFKDRLYDFAGTARYRIEGSSIEAPARGAVFLDKSLKPVGLILTVEDSKFARNRGLSVSTLDEDGMLGYSEDLAFAFTSRAFKLSHPMSMDCRTSPPSGSEDLWDWLPFG